jgi:hypothetical protein
MSRLPAILSAIVRKVDASSSAKAGEGLREPALPADGLRAIDPWRDELLRDDPRPNVVRPLGARDSEPREGVFNLVPPATEADKTEPPGDEAAKPEAAKPEAAKPEAAAPVPSANERNVHPVGTMDLTRLSIDNDGRLYWDGKPVEVRRRIMMSRAQISGAALIGVFVVIGAIGAAIQGAAAARDWACRLGWIESTCALPPAPQQRRGYDIPA